MCHGIVKRMDGEPQVKTPIPETPWILSDGSLGKVIAALGAAQAAVENVGKQKAVPSGGRQREGQMSYQAADEVLAVASRAVLEAGATYICTLGNPVVELLPGGGGHISVTAELRIVHPEDGSYTVHRAGSTALINKMGKYTAAASTGARKQVWMTALAITTGESDHLHVPEDPTPESVEFLLAEIDACQTRDELRTLCGTDEYRQVRGKWRSMLAQHGRQHEKKLIRLGEGGRHGTGAMVSPEEFRGARK